MAVGSLEQQVLSDFSVIFGTSFSSINDESFLHKILTEFNNQRSQISSLEQKARELEHTTFKLSNLNSEYSQVLDQYKRSNDFNQTLKAEIDSLYLQVKGIEGKADQLSSQKQSLIGALDEKQREIDDLNVQLGDLLQRNKLARDDFLSKDQLLIQKNKEVTQLNLQMASIRSQVDQSKTVETWTTKEIDRLNNELVSFKTAKLDEIFMLRDQNQTLKSDFRVLESKLAKITEQDQTKSTRIISLQEHLGSLQVQLKEQESAFIEEMNTKSRLIDIYKNNCNELTDQLDNLKADESLVAQESLNEGLSREITILKAENQTLKNRLEELDRFVHTFEVSPTAASLPVVSDAIERHRLNNELTCLRTENDRLKASLQEICRDVDDQVQIYQREKRDNERLKQELGSLSQQILTVSQQNERLTENLQDSRSVARQLELQVSTCYNQIKELKHIAGLIEGKSAFDKTSAAIEILQRRNDDLCRELAKYQSMYEEGGSSLRQQLADASDQIRKLQEQRDRQNSLLEAFSNKENSAPNIQPTSQQQQVIIEEHQKIVSGYQNQIAEYQSKLNQQSVFVAKLEANLQLLTDKSQMLEERSASTKLDLDRSKQMVESLLQSSRDLQKELHMTSQELFKCKQTELLEAANARSFQAEVNTSRENESKLSSLLAESSGEKERLVSL